MKTLEAGHFIDFLDFREPVFVGDPPVVIGWQIDWEAYHAACDQRDREQERKTDAETDK